ncbi:MAG: DUF4179 domain-containing protein [Lysinibacillus sp.]
MIEIPKDKLQQQRIEVFKKVRKERRRRKQLLSVATVAVLFISLLLSIRVSPTIANYAAKIPGLNVIVELMHENEGIKDAIENDYYEELGILKSAGDVTITLQGAIIDEYGVILMYDFDYLKPRSNHHNYDIRIYQGDKLIEAGYSFGTNDDIEGKVAHSEHKIQMTLDKPLDANISDFRLQIVMRDGDKQTIDIPFTLKQKIAKAKIVEPNEVVTMQGQRLIVKKIIRTPLSIQVEVDVDQSNTMQILSLDNVSVELSSGNKRESIRNGIIGSGSLRDGNYRFYLQSNYFYDAKELILNIGEVHAVKKGEDFIEVDFGREEVISKPDFIDWDIKVENHSVLYTAPVKNDHFRQHFYPAEKADGTVLDSASSSASSHDEQLGEYQEFYEPYDGIAKLWINYFDNPIAKNVVLKFDLQK